MVEKDHRLIQIIYSCNLTNCIRKHTRLGELFDSILLSGELETSFSDAMHVYRIKNDHDATIAFFPILVTYILFIKEMYGIYDGLNSDIGQFDWNAHLASLNDINVNM